MRLDQVIWNNTIENYIIAFAVLILFIAAGHIFTRVIIKILKKLASRTKTTLDDIIISILEKPAIFSVFVLGFYTASGYMSLGTRGYEILNNIMTVLIVWNIVWIINKLIDAFIEHYMAPLKNKKVTGLDDQLLSFIRKFLKVIVILIGALFLIKNMGYDITSLIAGLGIGGLAFALAAQPLLSNLFGGVAIVADKPFKIGDRIKIDQKYEGIVKEIGMRSTTLKTPIDTIMKIPNNVIATTVVENLSTKEENGVKFTLNLGLEYDTTAEKVEQALEIIREIMKENKNVVKSDDMKPSVTFWDFKDYYLQISGVYAIYPVTEIGKTRTAINLEIKKRFEKAHIHFAFPTQTLHVKKEHEHK